MDKYSNGCVLSIYTRLAYSTLGLMHYIATLKRLSQVMDYFIYRVAIMMVFLYWIVYLDIDALGCNVAMSSRWKSSSTSPGHW